MEGALGKEITNDLDIAPIHLVSSHDGDKVGDVRRLQSASSSDVAPYSVLAASGDSGTEMITAQIKQQLYILVIH